MAEQTDTAVDNPVGCLFIVAAPSGGGKTSLVQQLIADLDQIEMSISHTTRAKRPGEVDGVDYFFVKQQEFHQMVAANSFVEYATVFGYEYGTSAEQINYRLQQGIDVVLDIDWQGAQQIKRIFAEAVRIFILPPSLHVLRERLLKRQQDKDHVIESRMQRAQDEMRRVTEFDYVIVNDDFTKAAQELATIVMAERLRVARQLIKQQKLLSFLLSKQ